LLPELIPKGTVNGTVDRGIESDEEIGHIFHVDDENLPHGLHEVNYQGQGIADEERRRHAEEDESKGVVSGVLASNYPMSTFI